MMKKKIFFFAVATLLLCSCQKKHDGYTIKGNIAGEADGKKVFLMLRNEDGSPNPIDSTVISKNTFTLKGKIDEPQKCTIEFYEDTLFLHSKDKRSVLRESFYLENSDITFTAHIDSMKSFYYNPKKAVSSPRISGSKAEDLMNSYRASTKQLSKQYNDLWKEYLEVYHKPSMKNIFNTKEGVAISKEIESVSNLIKEKKLDFIENNPESVVSLDFAYAFIEGMYVELTAEEIDKMFAILSPTWNGNSLFESIKEKAEKAKQSIIGAQYPDIPVENMQGETVQLSSILPQGKYVLLEFWASWCGPCRGEIPHLKHAYNQFKSKGFDIVSISFDDSISDWKKAIDEEKMSWTQLRADGAFESRAAQKYGVLGVPFCLLINDKGVIVGQDVRGARLEMMLERYGILD